MNKKLYRSRDSRVICGVCGGLGEFLGIDETIIRLIWAVWCCVGIGILAYIVAAIVIPETP